MRVVLRRADDIAEKYMTRWPAGTDGGGGLFAGMKNFADRAIRRVLCTFRLSSETDHLPPRKRLFVPLKIRSCLVASRMVAALMVSTTQKGLRMERRVVYAARHWRFGLPGSGIENQEGDCRRVPRLPEIEGCIR